MTLREKFIKCRNKLNQYYVLPITDDAEQLEKIADDYAIEFAYWYEFTLRESDNLNQRFTPKELIEMFKKEKGL